jgi:hypothetical protein
MNIKYKDKLSYLQELGLKMNIDQIAKELNMQKRSARSLYTRYKIKYLPKERKRKLSSEMEKKIIELYSAKIVPRDISKILNVSRSDVQNTIIRFNVPKNFINPRSKKYSINENIFNFIDTEEKAYFLGLLYADGCNSDSGYVTLSLIEEDKYILEKFKTFLDYSGPILDAKTNKKYKNSQKAFRLNFCNQKISKDLINLGCFQRKTFTLEFPTQKQVPESLLHHFVRGYFDGDGCITWGKVKNYNCIKGLLTFVCNKNFGTKLKEYLTTRIGYFGITTHKHTKAIVVQSSKIQTLKDFEKYIYADAKIFFLRKREKLKKYISLKENGLFTE